MRAAGCERIFDAKVSGAKNERLGLTKALEQLRDGDTLVVWRLDRMGRSLKDLIARAEELKQMGVGLKSLQESIDTTSSSGQLIFHMFGALAEFERNLIQERTQGSLRPDRTALGPILETFVFGELQKLATWSPDRYAFSHYRDKDGNEVDIVIENRRGEVVGIEVKSSATVTHKDFAGLKHLKEASGAKFKAGYVLYDHDQTVPFGENLAAMPISALWV